MMSILYIMISENPNSKDSDESCPMCRTLQNKCTFEEIYVYKNYKNSIKILKVEQEVYFYIFFICV